MSNNPHTYDGGVADERSRCLVICEYWKRPAYIAVHYGAIDEVSMKVLQKVVDGISEAIQSGEQPK